MRKWGLFLFNWGIKQNYMGNGPIYITASLKVKFSYNTESQK